jgi:hypothetical protein
MCVYMYVYMHVYRERVSVCVCVRERERDRERRVMCCVDVYYQGHFLETKVGTTVVVN